MVKRYENENEESFIFRVCEAKGTDGLETWEDIANYLNDELGYDYTSSKYRKPYQYTQKVVEGNKDRFYDIDTQIEELEALKEEIRKERYKLQTVNIERNRIDRQDARQELFYEQVADYIKVAQKPNLEIFQKKNNERKYVQTIADVHYGDIFVSTTNEYNQKIVKDRFEILLSQTIDFIKDKGLNEFTVVLLGDLIQGVLRCSDLQAQDTKVVKCCVEVADLIVDYITKLSAYCNITLYDVIYANHSQTRYLGTKANSDMTEDLGYFIAMYIKKALSFNDRVIVKLPKENDLYLEIDNIFDFNIIALHGHQVKSIPNCLTDLSMKRRKFYDYALVGHLHSERTLTVGESALHDCEVLQSSSFCGTDEYADSLFKGSKGACEIYGFDKDFGKVETYKFILN